MYIDVLLNASVNVRKATMSILLNPIHVETNLLRLLPQIFCYFLKTALYRKLLCTRCAKTITGVWFNSCDVI
jgi:hypothetical protein